MHCICEQFIHSEEESFVIHYCFFKNDSEKVMYFLPILFNIFVHIWKTWHQSGDYIHTNATCQGTRWLYLRLPQLICPLPLPGDHKELWDTLLNQIGLTSVHQVGGWVYRLLAFFSISRSGECICFWLIAKNITTHAEMSTHNIFKEQKLCCTLGTTPEVLSEYVVRFGNLQNPYSNFISKKNMAEMGRH